MPDDTARATDQSYPISIDDAGTCLRSVDLPGDFRFVDGEQSVGCTLQVDFLTFENGVAKFQLQTMDGLPVYVRKLVTPTGLQRFVGWQSQTSPGAYAAYSMDGMTRLVYPSGVVIDQGDVSVRFTISRPVAVPPPPPPDPTPVPPTDRLEDGILVARATRLHAMQWQASGDAVNLGNYLQSLIRWAKGEVPAEPEYPFRRPVTFYSVTTANSSKTPAL
jgi:hypothetical protein